MSEPIDRERLQAALKKTVLIGGDLDVVHEAARRHLATLPEKPKVALETMVEYMEADFEAPKPTKNWHHWSLIEAEIRTVLRAIGEFRKKYDDGLTGQAGYDLFSKLPKP